MITNLVNRYEVERVPYQSRGLRFPEIAAVFNGGTANNTGSETVLEWARSGVKTIIVGHSAPEMDPSVRAEAEKAGATIIAVRADFSHPETIPEVARQVSEALNGRTIDLVMICSGITPTHKPGTPDAELSTKTFNINCHGPAAMAELLVPLMSVKGVIFFVGSNHELWISEHHADYGASKIALYAKFQRLARWAVKKYKVFMLYLAPGWTFNGPDCRHEQGIRAGTTPTRPEIEAAVSTGQIWDGWQIAQWMLTMFTLPSVGCFTGYRICADQFAEGFFGCIEE
jgi:NAD(P)-dependent dehydrogenase (short-subunit alcohol dehydrogenase family)